MFKKYGSVESDLYIEYDAEILYFSRFFYFELDREDGFERGIV